MGFSRNDGRRDDELRRITITRDYLPHAEGSAFLELGNTKVICTASVEEKVPPFLRGSGHGWVTAEYGMLPRSTETRMAREASVGRPQGRTKEIQRLIGRSLRAGVNLTALPELTIWVDCDVVQADGGTRTAAITGAFIALYDALRHLKENGTIDTLPVGEFIAATSVGVVEGRRLLDLSYQEDFKAEVDLNVVMTENRLLVEVQGTAEENPFSREDLNGLLNQAEKGIGELINHQKAALGDILGTKTK